MNMLATQRERRGYRLPQRLAAAAVLIAALVAAVALAQPAGASPDQGGERAAVLWTAGAGGSTVAQLVDPSGTVTKTDTVYGLSGVGQIVGQGLAYPNGDSYRSQSNLGGSVVYDPNSGEVRPIGTVAGEIQVNQHSFLWSCGAAGGCADAWKLVGYGDVNGDSHPDVVWFNASTDQVGAWLTDGTNVSNSSGTYLNITGVAWLTTGCSFVACGNTKVVAAGDFNNDGNLDLLSYDSDAGTLAVWLFNNSQAPIGTKTLPWTCGSSGGCATDWKLVGLSDVNQDSKLDLVWNDPWTGQVGYWLLDDAGGSVTGSGLVQTGTQPWAHILGASSNFIQRIS